MFRLSRNLEYSLIALKYTAIKAKGEISTAHEIAARYNLSFNLLARILLRLKNSGVLISIQGTKGGYALNRDLNNISLLELIEILSGCPFLLAPCKSHNHPKKRGCHIEKAQCNILDSIERIQTQMDDLMRRINLKEVLF